MEGTLNIRIDSFEEFNVLYDAIKCYQADMARIRDGSILSPSLLDDEAKDYYTHRILALDDLADSMDRMARYGHSDKCNKV